MPSDWSILSPETWLSSSWRMELRDGKLGLTRYEVTAGVLTVLSKLTNQRV